MSKLVFMVDDDVDLIEQNKFYLTEAGYKVETANSASEAVEKLQTIAKPDVMVIDVMMEHRTAGFTLAREIGRKYTDIPLIVMSGDPDKPSWMLQDNKTWDPVVSFLDKPVTKEKLIKTIEGVLANEK